MAQVSKRVRDIARARLEYAWAAKLSAARVEYPELGGEADRLAEIDWSQQLRKQVFLGQVDPDKITGSTAATFPLVILFTGEAANSGQEKFRTFSGTVSLHLEFVWSWRHGNALARFEDVGDLIEDTLVEVFHDREWLGAIGNGVGYNGEIAFSRGPVQAAGEHWRQTYACRLIFSVDV